MKRWYQILKIMLWCCVGCFIGSSLFKVYDYMKYPDIYAMQSAPWYLSIEIQAVFTIIFVTFVAVIMWIIKKKMK